MYAQEVEGYVLDYQGKPVEFASVAILTSTDSTLVGGCITLADGQFKVKVPGENKNVIVRVSHMSYEDAFQTKQVDSHSSIEENRKIKLDFKQNRSYEQG